MLSRRQKVGLVIGTAAATTLALGGIVVAGRQSSGSMTTYPRMAGVGEDYQLHWSYQRPPPDVVTAWHDYFASQDFITNKAKFGWNTIRLAFYFSDVYNSSSETPLDSTNLSLLDEVISICASNGLKAALSCFNWTGTQASSDYLNWLKDWQNLATHYKGNSNIAYFEIANELEASPETDNLLQTCTRNIKAIDPGRTVAWWFYSPSHQLGFQGNLISFHISVYGSAFPYGVFNAAHMVSTMPPSILGEINAQDSQFNQVTASLLAVCKYWELSYICWGYNAYRTNWDAIFALL